MRVSSESFSADTNWAMLDDTALGVGRTNGRSFKTRVDTALLNTSLSSLTVGIDLTFRFSNHWFNDSRTRLTTNEWIALVSVWTRTDGIVSNDLATGVNTTSSRTGIATSLIDTGQIVATIRIGSTFGFASDVRIAS